MIVGTNIPPTGILDPPARGAAHGFRSARRLAGMVLVGTLAVIVLLIIAALMLPFLSR
ncbi:MAG: hypothetical protein OXH42_04075 [Acidimicrobiaceae bacterium]|nr:hypothetical protein [Acidimicrobiaceae bacterium]